MGKSMKNRLAGRVGRALTTDASLCTPLRPFSLVFGGCPLMSRVITHGGATRYGTTGMAPHDILSLRHLFRRADDITSRLGSNVFMEHTVERTPSLPRIGRDISLVC